MADIIDVGNKQDKWTLKVTELLNWLNDNKQTILTAGDNITFTPLQDGSVRIDASDGGGGSSTLADLTDVSLTSPTDGQTLKYDATTQEWVNDDASGGGGNVDDVVMNGQSIVDVNKVASFNNYVELTQAEYDALPASKLTDGILYCIKDDGIVEGDKFAPVIYSFEEREIGTFVDGKPLYEKTLVRDFDSNTTGTEYTYTHGIENIDTCVSMEGHWVNTNNGQIQKGRIQPTSASSNNTTVNATISINLYLFSRTNLTWTIGSTWAEQGYYETRKLIATVRYTKTTDVPGSGTWGTDGVPMVHYSTSEKIVGTWFGETLYEETFDLGFAPNAGVINYPISLSNIDTIFIHDGFLFDATSKTSLPLNLVRPDGATYANGCFLVNGSSIRVITAYDRSTYKVYVTLRYTKTS